MTTTDLTTTLDAAPVVMMDRIEAQIALSTMRADLDEIETRLTSFRQQALDFREREGWRALNYRSYLEAIQQELSSAYSRSYLSRLLSAAEVERDLAPLPIVNAPESQLRPLAQLDKVDERREAWQQAQVLAGDKKITARHVQQAVDDLRTCTSCSQVSQALTVYAPDTLAIFPHGARLCATCIQALLRSDDDTPVEAAHDCACGQRATSKLTIAGLREWRCDLCAAADRAIEQQQQQEVTQALREVAEQAEALGATIDYTAYHDTRYVQVIPPARYQQTPLRCDVDDLRARVAAWTRHASEQAQPALSVVQQEQQERAHLLRLWKAIEQALDSGYRAVALKDARELVSILERGIA